MGKGAGRPAPPGSGLDLSGHTPPRPQPAAPPPPPPELDLRGLPLAAVGESELGILDLIQVFVETLDKCFENVCELDLIFHVDKVSIHNAKRYVLMLLVPDCSRTTARCHHVKPRSQRHRGCRLQPLDAFPAATTRVTLSRGRGGIAVATAPTSTCLNYCLTESQLYLRARLDMYTPGFFVFYGSRLAYDPIHRPTEWKLPPIQERIKMLDPQQLFLDYRHSLLTALNCL
ncbi:hypothetical protein GH733_005710 [Mirounga leonina]|nr:hypothetical protein GH733_005710 [Mirounga leonina]